MSKADEELNIDEEFANAYIDASTRDIPDLWDRIEAGYEQEYKKLKSDEKTLDLTNNKESKPLVMDIDAYRRRIDRGRIYNNTGEAKIVDFASVKAGKAGKKVSRRWIGLVAAVLLICIVAVPVAKSGLMDNKKSDETRREEASGDGAVYMEDTTQAADYEMSADESSAADSADISESVGETATLDSELDNPNINMIQENVTSDDKNSAETCVVSGIIENTDGMYVLIIKRAAFLPDGFPDLNAEDRILLVEGTDILDIEAGESAAYERIEIASVEDNKKTENTNTVGKTGEYEECKYVASLVSIE